MDFFERQDHARRQTRLLVILFTVSVVAIVLAIYLLLAVAAGEVNVEHHASPAAATLWHPALFLWVTLGTVLVVAAGSLCKIYELSAGGETVALMLGGRAVDPQTVDLAERRLLNVVEEMALASGVPVPPVYVLDREPGINAFAAGYQPGDAVVAVSAGCLQYLTREELQGVMGHEFSHILNGDMRLNLRLIGVVAGILVLATIGYYVMRSAAYVSSGSKKEGNGAAIAVFLLGLVLLILGYLGVFLGKLIKSAINRQREFLADASAVQFTRYPGGIAGALKKIGGLTSGSRIRDAHAEEVSHMFFGDAFAGSFFNLLATHPPLVERIQQLEPDFDGRFPEVRPGAMLAAAAPEQALGVRPGAPPPPQAAEAPYVAALDAGNMVQRIGSPQTEQLRQASRVVGAMPQPLLAAAREPWSAQALVYALLLSRDDEATRARQFELLQQQIEAPLSRQTQQLAATALSLEPGARLPLVDLAVPSLKKASPQQYARFREVVEALVGADGKVDLFEFCLRIVLLSYLDVHFGLKKPPAARYQTASAVAQPAAIVLATLAYVGQRQPEEIQRAFLAGAGLLGPMSLVPRQQCTLKTFDAALAELARASAKVKRAILSAVTACIATDGQVTLAEGELLRAIAAALGCPVPLVGG